MTASNSQTQTYLDHLTSMSNPLASIIRVEPISCLPETALREVLKTMQQHGIGSMVAVDANHKPVGIFTLHDLLSRVVLPELNLDTPLSAVMQRFRA